MGTEATTEDGTWARAWARATLVPAGRRATPVWIGVGTVAGIVFGFGAAKMHPHDLTSSALARPSVALVLAGAWFLLIAPVGRALVHASGTDFLRSLPSPRGARWVIAGAGAIAAQLPWAILWGIGEGLAAGALAAGAGAAITLAVGLARPIVRRPRIPRWRRRWTAAAGVHARGLIRTAGASLVRGAGLAVLGGAAGAALVRVNALTGAAAVTHAAAVDAALIAIALAGSIAAVADSERRLDWLARATGLGVARAGAIAIVLGTIGAALGAIAGLTAAALAGAGATDAIAITAAALAIGAGLGLAGGRIATWARRGDIVDGARVVTGVCVIGIAAVAAIGAFGPLGVAAVVAGGAAAAAANADALVRAAGAGR